MSNSELEKGLFSDLEDLDRKEIEQNVNDFERQIRTIEEEHKSLRHERKNQVEIVKSLRVSVGELEAVNDERRGLLKNFHEARKLAEKAREKRDEVNRSIPPPSSILSEWMGETYQRLVTVDNDLTAVPTLNREVEMFKRFFELQAAYTKKQDSEIYHSEYINHIGTIRTITKELDATRKNNQKENKDESGSQDDNENINRSDVRKLSRRISKIDKELDKLSDERKNLRKEVKRIRTYLRMTSSRGKPIKISEVKDRAQSGDSLNTEELGALLRTGGLSELTKDSKKVVKKKQIKKSSGKKQHRRLGVARGGARLGSRAAKRED
jgi:chromosome segregation ATPase|tara:strand:- start:113 stop:1084 length:972 start_codon:yes stop_codon:yes gene_type:complete